ncbi:PIG-L deacetylase family protein [Neobacillus sp. WH10]|uniref:PIG-L deacetylase family protein n=1 Tax=Neobacillus sp. WH10 TaxID=3047873 RepID=UPI0024C10A49|nr:PIG-L deacetylase family protein [Neobacillus sp. WH10]WHY76633.1 PIG-L deacetylase family protein [Neobacillus sp. WH10]
MSYLVVVAHPDDEILGAGATIDKLSQRGKEVNICVLSWKVEVRQGRPSLDELNSDMHEAIKHIGANRIITGTFPNIAFNTVNHVELVQFIEKAIIETQSEVIITHHPTDLNNDHYHTSIACQAAVKLYQRRQDVKPLKELLFMEVPSSTDWALNNSMNRFNPNVFIEIGEESLNKKIEALSMYRGVMREYPHPRSKETLKALAVLRGSQSGTYYAEAFESVFRRETI